MESEWWVQKTTNLVGSLGLLWQFDPKAASRTSLKVNFPDPLLITSAFDRITQQIAELL